jgi:hypothetical protein
VSNISDDRNLSELARPFVQTLPPWLLLTDASKKDVLDSVDELAFEGIIARTMSGETMTTKEAVLAAVANAFDFPDWFGRNWDALEELLGELDWIPSLGYAAWILGAEHLLKDDTPDQFRVLVSLLDSVASKWSKGIRDGEVWDRPACPFHIGFQTEEHSELSILVSKLKASGAIFRTIERS